MTPLEIAEHKQRWMASGNNHPVPFHSDWRDKAKDWCKQECLQHQFKHTKWSNVYEDTMYFEYHQHAESFSNYMKKITKKG